MPLLRCALIALCALLPLPASAALQHIELGNGFRAVLHPVPAEKAGDRVALRLVVGLGRSHENADQRGWAHLIEHMAFLGAGDFDRDAIDTLFDQQALRHGRDLNAYTAYHHTVYQASVPMAPPAVFANTLNLMQGWLSDVHFDPALLAVEKGVVRAELLSAASGTAVPTTEAWQAVMDPGAPTNQRNSPADLSLASTDALRAMWAHYYRPDNATLVVVGDIDLAAVAAQVERVFAPLTAPAAPLEPASWPELPATSDVALSQYNPDLPQHQLTLGFLRRQHASAYPVTHVALASLAQWWAESAAVVSACGAFHRQRIPRAGGAVGDFFLLSPAADRVESCLGALESAVQRATPLRAPEDLAAWRASLHKRIAAAHASTPSTTARDAAEGLVAYLVSGVPVRLPADEMRAALRWLDSLDAEAALHAVQAELTRLRTVVAFESADRSLRLPSKARLHAVAQRLAGERVAALPKTPSRSDVTVNTDPDTSLPVPPVIPRARIVSESRDKATGAREIVLDSGVRLWHTPSTGRREPLAIMVINRNNLLQSDPSVSAAARLLPALIDQVMAAAKPASVVARAREAGVTVSAFVETTRQGLILDAPARALSDAFALIGHSIRPGFGPDSWPSNASQHSLERWHSVGHSNARQLRGLLVEALYGVPWQPDTEAPDQRDLRDAYSRFFQHAAETDVIVVGDVPAALLRHVATQHLGGLAARQPDTRDWPTPSPANRIIDIETSAAVADVSVHYLQSADNGLDRQAAQLLSVRAALEKALWRALRAQAGLVYQLSVQLLRRPYTRGSASFVVHTQSAPEDAERVIAIIDDVVKTLQVTPLENRELISLRDQLLQDRRERLASNRGTAFEFALLREHGGQFADVVRLSQALEAVDAPSVRQFADRFFSESGRVSLVLSPPQK